MSKIPPVLADEMTPAVRAFVESLLGRIADLEARLGMTPQNSSLPPSSQHPHARPVPQKPKGKRKRGGQKGHPKHARTLLPPEQVDQTLVLKPTDCRRCGQRLAGTDPEPLRHQVWFNRQTKAARNPIIQEENRGECLILRGRRHVAIDSKPGQEGVNVGLVEIAGVRAIAKHQESLDPVDIRFLGTAAVMVSPKNVDQSIIQSRSRTIWEESKRLSRRSHEIARLLKSLRNWYVTLALHRQDHAISTLTRFLGSHGHLLNGRHSKIRYDSRCHN